jgi:hypothetical protein
MIKLSDIEAICVGVADNFRSSINRRRVRALGPGARVVSCYLRGSVDPYPRSLYRGRLEVPASGLVRFVGSWGTVRELTIPVNGLVIESFGPPTRGDGYFTYRRRSEAGTVLFRCRDHLGNRVDVLALPPYGRGVQLAIEATQRTVGPPGPQLERQVSRVRSLTPVFALVMAVLFMGCVAGMAYAVTQHVTGQLTRDTGSAMCRVEWTSPTGDDLTDLVACPADAKPGPVTLSVSQSGRAILAPFDTSLLFVGWFAALGVAVSFLARLIMWRRERPATAYSGLG